MFKKLFMASGLTALLLFGMAKDASATDTTTINEVWGKPTLVYGGALSPEEQSKTATIFGISDQSQVLTQTATPADMLTYLNAGDGQSAVMISSVLVQKQDPGTGVQVQILTPENITLITNEQYANAAITAGVTDASIQVAAISKVTGESALTGVYKAFEANGVVLDTQRTQVAQEELELTNQIVQENQGQTGFDASKLDQAMVEIKTQLADLKAKTGQLATKEEIQSIINAALEKYQLASVITQNQINILVNFALNYQNTSAIDSQTVKEQLGKLSQSLTQGLNQVVDQAKQQGWWDKFLSFLQGIVDSIRQNFQ